jgi:glycogen operon protein
LLILLNAYHEMIPFILPAHRRKVRWQVVLDTFDPSTIKKKSRSMRGGDAYELMPRSLVVLRLPTHVEGEDNKGEGLPLTRRLRRGTVTQKVAP